MSTRGWQIAASGLLLLAFLSMVPMALGLRDLEHTVNRQQIEIDRLIDWVKVSDRRQSVLSENDQIVVNRMNEAQDDIEGFKTRMRYYRQQMQVVVDTCPGRARLPNLPGAPDDL